MRVRAHKAPTEMVQDQGRLMKALLSVDELKVFLLFIFVIFVYGFCFLGVFFLFFCLFVLVSCMCCPQNGIVEHV